MSSEHQQTVQESAGWLCSTGSHPHPGLHQGRANSCPAVLACESVFGYFVIFAAPPEEGCHAVTIPATGHHAEIQNTMECMGMGFALRSDGQGGSFCCLQQPIKSMETGQSQRCRLEGGEAAVITYNTGNSCLIEGKIEKRAVKYWSRLPREALGKEPHPWKQSHLRCMGP